MNSATGMSSAPGIDATILPCGERAFLVETDGLDAVMALDHALRARFAGRSDVVDVLPATRTVLIRVADPAVLDTVKAQVSEILATASPEPPESAEAGEITIPVHYDGPDLAEIASLTGLSKAEVVAAHVGTPWRVAFVGFAPGFPYLVGGDPRLEVPRRSQPRTHVPAGAVGLAGAFSGVYPRVSPGGWQLLGHTATVMWDLNRQPPALAGPGTVVRFEDAGPAAENAERPADVPSERRGEPDGTGVEATSAEPPGTLAEPGSRYVEVLATGPLAIATDRGRPGLAHLGVGASGPTDRNAYELGQRLLEADGAAAIEVTFGGLSLRAHGAFSMVVTGADTSPTVDGRGVGMNAPFFLLPGQTLTLATPAHGLRSYVGVRGGLEVESVLGSRATDVLSGIGPAPLRVGDRIPVGAPRSMSFSGVDQVPVAARKDGPIVVEVLPGPRDGWFESLTGPAGLVGRDWTVSSQSNRVGVRLQGDPIARRGDRAGELPTEGTVRGAIQVPSGGEPVVFLADHPVTGGYPVIGVVTDEGADALAQARPGDTVRFRLRNPERPGRPGRPGRLGR